MRGRGFVQTFTGALTNIGALTNRDPACLPEFVVRWSVTAVVRLRVRNFP